MKLIAVFITAGLAFTAAGQETSNTNTKSESKKVTRVPPPPTIPPDAKPLPDGSFRYVDKDGKKWIYRQTPFGVSKAEERPVAQMTQRIEDDPARSQDLGDSVRFTRPTPFGNKVWTTKKSELDTYEKSIFERDQQKNASKHDGAGEQKPDAKPAGKSPDTPKQD